MLDVAALFGARIGFVPFRQRLLRGASELQRRVGLEIGAAKNFFGARDELGEIVLGYAPARVREQGRAIFLQVALQRQPAVAQDLWLGFLEPALHHCGVDVVVAARPEGSARSA